MLRKVILSLTTATTLIAAPVSAQVSNFNVHENSTGTREIESTSYVHGTSHNITVEDSVKIDASGAGATGDIHVSGGQLSGSAWSRQNDGKDPAFVAGQVERSVTTTITKFGTNTNFGEWSEFNRKESSFTLD